MLLVAVLDWLILQLGAFADVLGAWFKGWAKADPDGDPYWESDMDLVRAHLLDHDPAELQSTGLVVCSTVCL